MFVLIASAALAGAPAVHPAPLHSSRSAARPVAAADALPVAPWWEKITVTMNGDGKTQSCEYQSSSHAQPSDACALFSAGMNDSESADSAAERGQYTKLTFERSFSPGTAVPADAPLATGDTLLGRELMAVAINGRGKVTGCKMVATSGDLPPDYSCNDASAERFATAGKDADRQGFFTVRIYGHSEHVALLPLGRGAI